MGWHHLADTFDLAERDVVGREHAGLKVALYRVEGRYYATSNLCTHAFALLAEGEVVDGYIECPLHYGLFEIATGKALGGYVMTDLETYPVRIDGDRLLVELPEPLHDL